MRGLRNERSSTLSARTLPSRAKKPSPSRSPPGNPRGASARKGDSSLLGRQARARAKPPRDRAHAVGALVRALRTLRLGSGPVAGVDTRAMGALSAGHLATDLAQGSLPALLPYLVDKFELSYTMAAALVLAATISSSLIQPAFGIWSDARGALWLLPVGVALSGLGMAATAIAPSYWVAVVCVLVAGLGVAAYHPEGSKFASYVSGARRASGMAFFSVGGNVGFALGPILAAGFILAFGLHGAALLAVPGLLIAGALVFVLRYLADFAPSEPRAAAAQAGETERRGLALLLGVVGL